MITSALTPEAGRFDACFSTLMSCKLCSTEWKCGVVDFSIYMEWYWKNVESFLALPFRCKNHYTYSVLLLEVGRLPIEFHALMRIMQYIVQVQQMRGDRLLCKAREASMKLQKNHKSKVLSTWWGSDIDKWFNRWNVSAYLTMPPKKVDMTAFQLSLLESLQNRWLTEKKRVKLEYCQEYINPSCWSMYKEQDVSEQPYICIPIPIAYRRNFGTISHTKLHSSNRTRWMAEYIATC